MGSEAQQQQFQPFGKKSDQVMMMVPMMVHPDGGAQQMVMPQAMHSGTNFSSMCNPFVFMKPQSSPSMNTNQNKGSEATTNQQQFVQMVHMQGSEGGDIGDPSLAHCA